MAKNLSLKILRPNQKSPVPLNRYADVNGHQEDVRSSAGTPNSTLRSNQGYKMVARALYNFQPQNHRELGFKKGDIIYVRRQVDANWYEGERNAMIGIFPTSYVEVIPEGEVSSLRSESTFEQPHSESLLEQHLICCILLLWEKFT